MKKSVGKIYGVVFYLLFFPLLVFFTRLINSASQQANPVRFQLFLFLCNSIAARKQLAQCIFFSFSFPFILFYFTIFDIAVSRNAAAAAAASKSLQSCPTPCDLIDSSPPDSP